VARSRPRFNDAIRTTAVAAALAIVVAACSNSANAGWTFAPEPSITPAPSSSGGASAAPSAAGGASAPASAGASTGASAPASGGTSAAPGTSPNPGGSAPAGGGTSGETTVRVKALNIAFDTQQIQAPGGQAFIIEFDNQDAGIPHNIDILDPNGTSVFKGDLVTGTAQATYQVPALTKGTAYKFQCDVHPTMTGTVAVQ
jgi:plastocyanin